MKVERSNPQQLRKLGYSDAVIDGKMRPDYASNTHYIRGYKEGEEASIAIESKQVYV